jgi:curved DNA-binding protein CbpA
MTHYDTLEISGQASPEVVRAAYRSLIQRFHPDRLPGDASAAARAAAITAAYEVLSDPVRRAAYDEELAAGHAGAAPRMGHDEPAPATDAAGRSRAAQRPASRSIPARTPWLWALMVVPVVLGAVWLAMPKPDPQGELASIRRAFAAGGLPEARLRELHARKASLLQEFPDLRVRAFAEASQDREARTVDLLAVPLVLQLEQAQLTIPRLRVVLGSFDAGSLRVRMERQGDRLRNELALSLARADAVQLQGPLSETYLKAIVLGALARELVTQPQQDYPSTYFESPGRHGVVEVLLPERFELRPV